MLLQSLTCFWILYQKKKWVSHGSECEYMDDNCHRLDDGGSKFLSNVGKLLPDYTTLKPRSQPSFRDRLRRNNVQVASSALRTTWSAVRFEEQVVSGTRQPATFMPVAVRSWNLIILFLSWRLSSMSSMDTDFFVYYKNSPLFWASWVHSRPVLHLMLLFTPGSCSWSLPFWLFN
jgi:hypothetical protein